MKRVLVAGCGDLGTRLSACLDTTFWELTGLRRDPSALAEPIVPLAADLLDPDSLAGIEPQWDAVIYQATPSARDERAYRRTYIEGLANLLDRVSCRRLIFVSSTAVYGQDRGEWVDEETPTEPAKFNGQVLVEAERQALEAGARTMVVRFSGIYGPGRDYLIRTVKAGQARCRPEPPQWTNRIHADDCARVLAHVLEMDEPAPVYCASDPAPSPRCEVFEWLAGQLGVPGPAHDPPDTSAGCGKRISNRRLLDTGFSFRYPDYRAGYGAMLK